MTYPGQRHIVEEVVLLWTHWSRDGILCEGLINTEGAEAFKTPFQYEKRGKKV